MKIREQKKAIFKAEGAGNVFPRDGEGYTFPYELQNFHRLNSGNKWGYLANYDAYFGQGKLGYKQVTTFTGDGVTTSFTGATFSERINPRLGIMAVIGAAVFGWTDTDGTRQVIVDRVVGYGTGAATVFTLYVGTASILPDSLVLKHTETATPRTATSSGGTISGTNIAAGTVNETTGVISVTFTNPPDVSTAITVSYTVDSYANIEQSETLGTGNGTATAFTLNTAFGSIRTRSARLTATVGGNDIYLLDNGAGNFVELGTAATLTAGTINYTSGAISLTWATAPDAATSLTITYCQKGLNKSSVNYTTGGSIDLRFDVGSEPANNTRIILVGSTYAVTEYAGNDVGTGIIAIGNTSSKAGFRTARSYLDSGSEDFAKTLATLRTQPLERNVISFYAKSSASTAKCYIRAWTGVSANIQVSIGSTDIDWFPLTGAVTRIADPADGTKFCLQCAITSTMTRFGAYIWMPATAYCLSVEFEGDTTCAYLGEQTLFVTGLSWSTGTELAAYTRNAAWRSIPLPLSNFLGKNGQVLTTLGDGTTAWVDIATVGGAGITQLNGLTAATQSFAVGTSGTAPAVASVGSTHTINIPMASAGGVTAGLISKADYDAFSVAAGGSNLTVDLIPNADDTYDIGTALKRWSTTYTKEIIPNYIGSTNDTVYTGGRVELTKYLQGVGGLTIGYNAYDSNISGASRGTTSNAGYLLSADSNSIRLALTEAGVGATNSGDNILTISNIGNLVIGRTNKVWSANRFTDTSISLVHPIESDYDKNFASPQYDPGNYPLLTVRGVTSGTGKGPVIAFARDESTTLPIAGIWAKTAASGSGLDKFSFLASTNDTSWPTEVASITSAGRMDVVSLYVNGTAVTAATVPIGAIPYSFGGITLYKYNSTNTVVFNTSTTKYDLKLAANVEQFPQMFGSANWFGALVSEVDTGETPVIGKGGKINFVPFNSYPVTSQRITAVNREGTRFVIVDIGITNRVIYVSTNGTTWGAASTSFATADPDMCFASGSLIAVSRNGGSGFLYFTTNDGSSWTTVATSTSFKAIGYGISGQTKMFFGVGNTVYYWNGASFTSVVPGSGSGLSTEIRHTGVAYSGRYVYIDSNGWIVTTDDNFANSTTRYNSTTVHRIFSSPDGNYLLGLGKTNANKTSVYSTDQGTTWTALPTRLNMYAVSTDEIFNCLITNDGFAMLIGNMATDNNCIGIHMPGGDWHWITVTSGQYLMPRLLSNADGSKMLSMMRSNIFYTSNYGDQWTVQASCFGAMKRTYTWDASSTLSHVLSGSTPIDAVTTNLKGYLMVSTDYCATWTKVTAAGARYWYDFAVSASGSVMVAMDSTSASKPYISTDSGVSFAASSAYSRTTPYGCAIAKTTGRIYTVGATSGTFYIDSSDDNGTTWTNRGNISSYALTYIAVSPNGTYLIIFGTSTFWVSSDSGATWRYGHTNQIIYSRPFVEDSGRVVFGEVSRGFYFYISDIGLNLIGSNTVASLYTMIGSSSAGYVYFYFGDYDSKNDRQYGALSANVTRTTGW